MLIAGLAPSSLINAIMHRFTVATIWQSPASQLLGRLVMHQFAAYHGAFARP